MKLFLPNVVVLLLLVFAVGFLGQSHAAHPAQALLAADQQKGEVPGKGSVAGESVPEKGMDAAERSKPISVQQGILGGFTISGLQVALEQFLQVLYWRLDIILTANLAKVPYDLTVVFDRISKGRGVSGFVQMFLLLLAVFSLALVVEYCFRKAFLHRLTPEVESGHCQGQGRVQVWTVLLRAVPQFIALGVFVGAAYGFYVLMYAEYFSGICPLYLSMQTTIIGARCVAVFSSMVFSPTSRELRLLPLGDEISRIAHNTIRSFAWLAAGGFLFVSLVEHGGLSGDSRLFIRICFGSIMVLAAVLLLLFYRVEITRWMEGDTAGKGIRGWLAAKWLPLSLSYAALLWILWVVRLLIAGPEFGFAFAVSFLIVPIYMMLDTVLGWLLHSIVVAEEPKGTAEDEEQEEEALRLVDYLQIIGRGVLVLFLFLWVLSLWGEGVQVSEAGKNKAAEVLVILCVFYLVWKVITKAISIYLEKRARIHEDSEEDVDSEWGDAPMLDRGQTLLPIIRKFVGIIMSVMVVLYVLSSLGVNIAPLLAGAGVVGIAIGFGAQKLVSDVLSGFFYLLDDAFRVGEYVKTSEISGVVEKITLRNVMLRHHRGMLQIVPYSDLGAITNYMRGGIIVKFNLQFPYDTNVDQVRKVIKKVGIAMLEDPEYGKNFIKQVKSQGIREVADSVLTIRVKFTAQPGTHFVIRREAYRRITEALNAKGIFYAHRKVIVEVPEDESGLSDMEKKRIAEAGAAAQLATEKKNEEQAQPAVP